MPDKRLLEEYPLYRRFAIEIPRTLNHIPKPPIYMLCEVCGGPQTFRMQNEYYAGFEYSNFPSENAVVRAQYVCMSCVKFHRDFMIHIAADCKSVRKVGQNPAWDTTVSSDVQRFLGAHTPTFKKGLICEAQGYGIGAFAYYRRITEQIIGELLSQIGDLVPEDERAVYDKALEAVKKTIIAQQKIELVKDLLPLTLRPDGMNPLSILHGALSEGIHARSDEECLELAAEVREILAFLVTQVSALRSTTRTFTASMRKLLEKRGGGVF